MGRPREHVADLAQHAEVGIVERLVGRRQVSVQDSVTPGTSGSSASRAAAWPGSGRGWGRCSRPACPGRRPPRVVRPRREGDDPQQFLAARGEPADGGPQQPPLVVEDDLFLRAGPGGGQFVERLVIRGDLLAARGADPPGLPAVVVTSQPVSAAESWMPSRCVTRRSRPSAARLRRRPALESGRARDLPQQRAEFVHDLAERVLAARPGRAHQVRDPRGPVGPVLPACAGHDGAGHDGPPVTGTVAGSSMLHQPGQPTLFRAASARYCVSCGRRASA